jgi:hypothetical protein
MDKPPTMLAGARVLRHAIIDSSIECTGKISVYVDGKLVGPAAGLAISKYNHEDCVCIFYCNEKWDVFAAAEYPTVEKAVQRMEIAYRGSSKKWETMA